MTLARFVTVREARDRPLAPLLLALAPAALILGLILVMLWTGFRTETIGGVFTLDNYRRLADDPTAMRALVNTLQFALATLVVASGVGVFLAWVVERTDFGQPRIVYAALTLGVLIPGFFVAMGWLFLVHPRSGILLGLFRALGLRAIPFDIITPLGMGVIQGITLAPVVFVILIAAFRAVDSSLEEAAAMAGASSATVIRRITLPLLTPALAGAAIYVFVIGVSAFDVPAVIGMANRVLTFSTYLAQRINPPEGLPQYGVAAAFSTLMVALALGATWLYARILERGRSYQVVGGKSWRTRRTPLGRWRFVAGGAVVVYLLLAQGLPLAVLVWSAFLPYLQPFSYTALRALSWQNFDSLPWPLLATGFRNTLVIALVAPLIAILTSLLFSWIVVRTKFAWRYAFDAVAFLPHAVPAIVFGLSAVIASLYLSTALFDIYGSLGVLLVVMALTQVSFGTRLTNAALIQISGELDEAAEMAGASRAVVAWRILLPLLRPACVFGWLWLAMLSIRELTLSVVLTSSDSITFSVAIFTLLATGEAGQASAAALLMILFLLPPVLLYLRFADGGAQTTLAAPVSSAESAP